jgi:hypothetical protein
VLVCFKLAVPKLRGHNGRLCLVMDSAERTCTHLAHMEVCALSLCFFFFSHVGAFRLIIMAWLGDFRDMQEDTQNITDLKVAHRYLRSLEGTPTLHV